MADKLKASQAPKPLSDQLLLDDRQAQVWQRPIPDILKLNSDGAFLEQTGEGGWGYVIRNHHGSVQKLGAGRERFLQSAFHAELLGCLEGLRMTASMRISNIILETDALTVKAALEGREYRLSSMGGIIAEIKHLMASDFVMCKVSFCPRVCNKLAHELAAIGCKLLGSPYAIWDDVPHSLEDLVTSDSARTEE
jgi:hypothetical protein